MTRLGWCFISFISFNVWQQQADLQLDCHPRIGHSSHNLMVTPHSVWHRKMPPPVQPHTQNNQHSRICHINPTKHKRIKISCWNARYSVKTDWFDVKWSPCSLYASTWEHHICMCSFARWPGSSFSESRTESLLQQSQCVASLGTQTQICWGTTAVAESFSADKTS